MVSSISTTGISLSLFLFLSLQISVQHQPERLYLFHSLFVEQSPVGTWDQISAETCSMFANSRVPRSNSGGSSKGKHWRKPARTEGGMESWTTLNKEATQDRATRQEQKTLSPVSAALSRVTGSLGLHLYKTVENAQKMVPSIRKGENPAELYVDREARLLQWKYNLEVYQTVVRAKYLGRLFNGSKWQCRPKLYFRPFSGEKQDERKRALGGTREPLTNHVPNQAFIHASLGGSSQWTSSTAF